MFIRIHIDSCTSLFSQNNKNPHIYISWSQIQGKVLRPRSRMPKWLFVWATAFSFTWTLYGYLAGRLKMTKIEQNSCHPTFGLEKNLPSLINWCWGDLSIPAVLWKCWISMRPFPHSVKAKSETWYETEKYFLWNQFVLAESRFLGIQGPLLTGKVCRLRRQTLVCMQVT